VKPIKLSNWISEIELHDFLLRSDENEILNELEQQEAVADYNQSIEAARPNSERSEALMKLHQQLQQTRYNEYLLASTPTPPPRVESDQASSTPAKRPDYSASGSRVLPEVATPVAQIWRSFRPPANILSYHPAAPADLGRYPVYSPPENALIANQAPLTPVLNSTSTSDSASPTVSAVPTTPKPG
jgi:hypothetical protein